MNEFDKHKQPDEPARDPDTVGGAPFQVDVEVLSAYLEDPAALDADQRQQVEQALASDPDVRRTFDELDALTSTLADMPELSAPRSYRLTPEMVGERVPAKVIQSDVWYLRHMEKVRWAAAAVALLFVLTVSADLVVNGLSPSGTSDDAAQGEVIPEAAVEDSAAGAESDADRDAAADDSDSVEGADAPGEAQEEAVEEEAAPEELEESDGQASDGDDEAGDSDEPDASILAVDPTPTGESAGLESPESAADVSPTASDDVTAMRADEDNEADTGADGESDRAAWRAVQFGLVLTLAVLLGMILILPRWRRPPN